MNILGLSFYYHDSSAALVKDGVLVAAAEEEHPREHAPEALGELDEGFHAGVGLGGASRRAVPKDGSLRSSRRRHLGEGRRKRAPPRVLPDPRRRSKGSEVYRRSCGGETRRAQCVRTSAAARKAFPTRRQRSANTPL